MYLTRIQYEKKESAIMFVTTFIFFRNIFVTSIYILRRITFILKHSLIVKQIQKQYTVYLINRVEL